MYNHNKAQQSKNRVHISWDILYVPGLVKITVFKFLAIFLMHYHLVFVMASVQTTSHYLNQWWLVYRCIYASFGLNELTTGFGQNFRFLFLAYIPIFPFHFVMRFSWCVCCEELHRQSLWRYKRRLSLTTLGCTLALRGLSPLVYNEGKPQL